MTRQIGLILLACGLALLLACNGSSGTSPASTPRPLHSCRAAQRVCEQFVTKRLKTPATAQFGDTECTGPSKGACYVVTGHVDAQNTYGALVRSDYTCHVCATDVKDGQQWYHLEDLSIRAW